MPNDAVILTSPSPHVRVLTLNRPESRNAITDELNSAWIEAIAGLRRDDSIRALVISGAGSAFCSGADLSWLDHGGLGAHSPAEMGSGLRPTYDAWLAPRSLPFPVIAAINGSAIGAGLCVALATDLRIATPTAKLSVPFTFLGTHGGMGVTHLLPETIGIVRAREMLYTGKVLAGEEAVAWDLVNETAEDPLARAVELATRIATAAPIATRLTKVGLRQARHTLEAAVEWELLAQPLTLDTADIHEGIAATRERRTPDFQGR